MTTHPTQDDATFGDAFDRRKDRAPAAPATAPVRHDDGSIDWQARRARLEAQQAERDRLQQLADEAEQARVRALPVADAEVDADPSVAELEQRVADGDESVTEAMLTKARAAAAGRVRFARLRGVFDARTARKDAEQLELEQAAAAEQYARAALAAHGPAELVAAYDGAVDALRALTAMVNGRNDVVMGLVQLPAAARVRGAVFDVGMNAGGHRLTLDGVVHRPQQVGEVVRQAMRRARIVSSPSGALRVVGEHEHVDTGGHDPAIIAAARAQLAEQTGDDAA